MKVHGGEEAHQQLISDLLATAPELEKLTDAWAAPLGADGTHPMVVVHAASLVLIAGIKKLIKINVDAAKAAGITLPSQPCEVCVATMVVKTVHALMAQRGQQETPGMVDGVPVAKA